MKSNATYYLVFASNGSLHCALCRLFRVAQGSLWQRYPVQVIPEHVRVLVMNLNEHVP
jgi:hypothetical protein